MSPPADGLIPSTQLRTIRTAHCVVVVDYVTGAVELMMGEAEQAWLTCVNGDGTRDDPRVSDWIRRGWLIPGIPDANTTRTTRVSDPITSWGTQEVLAFLPSPEPCPWRWRLAALPVLVLTIAVQHHGFKRHKFRRMLRLCRAGTRLPPATTRQARNAVLAVRWAARLVPARVACLEESVTGVLLLAAAGRRGGWRHGIATDPIRLHAWIVDAEGNPVAEPTGTGQYTVITEIPHLRPKEIRP
jgi:Transglutaminase-like superfamily